MSVTHDIIPFSATSLNNDLLPKIVKVCFSTTRCASKLKIEESNLQDMFLSLKTNSQDFGLSLKSTARIYN